MKQSLVNDFGDSETLWEYRQFPQYHFRLAFKTTKHQPSAIIHHHPGIAFNFAILNRFHFQFPFHVHSSVQ